MKQEKNLVKETPKVSRLLKRAVLFGVLSGLVLSAVADEVLIRPSVWGQEKWYGGYELYSGDKKIGAVRPSVWGTEMWPGGYDLLEGERKAGEAKASEWGQTNWYGGYNLKLDENDKKVFESVLRNILNK